MKQKQEVKRGDIYYADLPEETIGSQQSGRRPVLITQNDYMNERAPTVLVAAVTSVIKRLDLMTHVLLPKDCGLPKESMVMAEQRYTLDKQSLIEYRCTLPDEVMRRVDRAIHYSEAGNYSKRPYKKKKKK